MLGLLKTQTSTWRAKRLKLHGRANREQAMNRGGYLLVLFADQSAGEGGLEMPFFGQNCLVSRAPAVLALRYDCELFVPICYRLGLGRWVIETGVAIDTQREGKKRSSAAITRDINAAMEAAVRRDPANWFWVHNRWKPRRNSLPGDSLAN